MFKNKTLQSIALYMYIKLVSINCNSFTHIEFTKKMFENKALLSFS